jgi:transcriptional regulator with XRE-family HTH domain
MWRIAVIAGTMREVSSNGSPSGNWSVVAGSVDPGTQRRRLGRELRPLREQRNLTQGEAAKELEWSLTKIIRIEKGAVGVSVTDLRALLTLYGETNRKKVARLMDLARGGHGQSWSDQYRDVISYEYAQYLALEGSASAMQVFHPFLVPGLLQIVDYSEALADSHQESTQNRRMVDLRMQRQNQLFGDSGGGQDDPAQLTFLLSEAALRQWIGGPAVMAAQLQHVLDISERPNVGVRIIPFSAGAHPGLLGSSILIQLPDDEWAVFNEGSPTGLTEDNETTTKTVEYFETMEEIALSTSETAELIGEMIGFFTARATATDSPAAAAR